MENYYICDSCGNNTYELVRRKLRNSVIKNIEVCKSCGYSKIEEQGNVWVFGKNSIPKKRLEKLLNKFKKYDSI